MPVAEKPICFTVDHQRVVGVLHLPEEDQANGLGVVFCHGWSGCGLGPHRMFVKTARRLADLGVCCLRIDFRGRGASGGDTAACGIATMTRDATAAVDFMLAETAVEKTILLGICSGAKVAIGAATGDPRITGLALWSAEALGDLREAKTNRRKTRDALLGYARKLLKPQTWRKLVTGKVDTASVRKAVLVHETRSAAEARRENASLQNFRGFRKPLLMIYGGNDPDTKLAGRNYADFCATHGLTCQTHVIPEANHSFYSLAWEAEVIGKTVAWLTGFRELPRLTPPHRGKPGGGTKIFLDGVSLADQLGKSGVDR